MSCSHWFESQWVGCGGQLEYPSFAGLVVLPYRISAFKLRGVIAADLTILPLTSITCTHEQASGVVTCQLPTRAQTSPRLPASNAPRALRDLQRSGEELDDRSEHARTLDVFPTQDRTAWTQR